MRFLWFKKYYKYNSPPCLIVVDVNGDKKPNRGVLDFRYFANGDIQDVIVDNHTYPSPSDKKFSDTFLLMITDEKAIPYGVVAQRAMYSK